MKCAKGHASTEPDYCSVCGAPVVATACPDCGEPRASARERHCAICRFDFQTNKRGAPPVAALRWELVLELDASLDDEPDPGTPFPADAPGPRTIAVEKSELLVGRRDEPRDIIPDVDLVDPGASRRHAKILRAPDGSLLLQDLAPANGTRLNGKDVTPGTRLPLHAGDTITIGRWTRIRVTVAR